MRSTPVQVTPDGHHRDVWAPTLAAAPRVTLDRLAAAVTPATELVVLAAHPDDETLGLGRLANTWGRTVGRVTAVLATAGEACVDHVMERPPGIAARRIAEWHAALAELGISGRHVLALPDGGLSDHEAALTTALTGVVVSLRDTGRPVVLAAPWRGDPHPDHRAAGRAAATVAAAESLPLLEYGVWMTFWGEPADLSDRGQALLVVPPDDRAEQAYRAACRSFTSQLEPITAYATPVVPPAMLDLLGEQLLIVGPELAATIHERIPA